MGQLILFPQAELGQQDPSIDVPALLFGLRSAGLMAAASEDFELPSGTNAEIATHFAAGPRFMQLLTFMGCMPFLVLDPTEGKQQLIEGGIDGFCHLRWLEYSEPPWLLATRFSVARFSCPQCNAKGEYVTDASAWGEPWQGVQCHDCGAELDRTCIRWRRSGAITACALTIWGIEPKEAVPSAELIPCFDFTDNNIFKNR